MFFEHWEVSPKKIPALFPPSMTRRRHRPAHLCAPAVQWGAMPKHTHQQPMRAGDWLCDGCGANNYARRQRCYICNTSPDHKRRCGFDAAAKREDWDVRPGDWQCGACGNVCYARRNKCFHCLEPRGAIEPIVAYPLEWFRPGDWLCPKCDYHNFKGRARCYCCRYRA